MPLNQPALKDAILAAMNGAESQAWSKDQVAAAWASAIDVYVRGGEIVGVASTVTVQVRGGPFPETAAGSASQSNAAPLHLT